MSTSWRLRESIVRKVAIGRSACAELICVDFKAVMAARVGKMHTEIISPCIDAMLMQRFLLNKMHQRLLQEST